MNASNANRGMTLVELLVATAVLSLALVPVSDLLLTNSRQTRTTIERLAASARARMILDRFRCMEASWLTAEFPADGTGSARATSDRLLALDSADTAASVLETEERRQAAELEERFADDIRFHGAGNGRQGQLVVRIGWESAASRRHQVLIASEWISERSR